MSGFFYTHKPARLCLFPFVQGQINLASFFAPSHLTALHQTCLPYRGAEVWVWWNPGPWFKLEETNPSDFPGHPQIKSWQHSDQPTKLCLQTTQPSRNQTKPKQAKPRPQEQKKTLPEGSLVPHEDGLLGGKKLPFSTSLEGTKKKPLGRPRTKDFVREDEEAQILRALLDQDEVKWEDRQGGDQ